MTDQDPARWLSPVEQAAWTGLVRMHSHLMGKLERELQSASGLSASDYAVLVVLTAAPEGIVRANHLGRELGWEKSRLSHHLARMEARGLVGRHTCPEDQRGLNVSVTAAGQRAIESAAPAHVESVRRWFIDQLTPGDLEVLARVFTVVDAALEGPCEDGCG